MAGYGRPVSQAERAAAAEARQATLDKLKHWPAMTDQQSREFTDAYQAVTR